MTLAICLLVIAFGLVMAEIAIPSFGFISLLAGAAYTWALVIAFGEGGTTGWSFVALGVILLPVAIGIGVKLLPNTAIGRRLVLRAPKAAEVTHATSQDEPSELVGQTGVALSDLRPTGIARIGDDRIDVVAGGRYILKGTPLVVSTVQGNRIVVEEHHEQKETQP